jgi:hypothetical protein
LLPTDTLHLFRRNYSWLVDQENLFIDLAPDFLALTFFAMVFVFGSIAKFRKTL